MTAPASARQRRPYLAACAFASLGEPSVSQILVIVGSIRWGIRSERQLSQKTSKEESRQQSTFTNSQHLPSMARIQSKLAGSLPTTRVLDRVVPRKITNCRPREVNSPRLLLVQKRSRPLMR